jgi:hypothetical protein
MPRDASRAVSGGGLPLEILGEIDMRLGEFNGDYENREPLENFLQPEKIPWWQDHNAPALRCADHNYQETKT